MKILIVDDEPYVREHLVQLFCNYETRTAINGKEGLEIYKKEGDFDLVISDHTMPGMSGTEFLDRVHSLNNDQPMALFTGHTIDFKKFLPEHARSFCKLYIEELLEYVAEVADEPYEARDTEEWDQAWYSQR
jgi:CheY-like chemotaxis protein